MPGDGHAVADDGHVKVLDELDGGGGVAGRLRLLAALGAVLDPVGQGLARRQRVYLHVVGRGDLHLLLLLFSPFHKKTFSILSNIFISRAFVMIVFFVVNRFSALPGGETCSLLLSDRL